MLTGPSTRPSKRKHHPAIVSVEPVRWKQPSATRNFHGLQVALPPLWSPGDEPNGKKWPFCNCFVVHDSPYVRVPSMLSRRPSGSELPIRLGSMNSGSTWSSQAETAGAMYPLRTQSRARSLCCTTRSTRLALHLCFFQKSNSFVAEIRLFLKKYIVRLSSASPWRHQARPLLLDSRGESCGGPLAMPIFQFVEQLFCQC